MRKPPVTTMDDLALFRWFVKSDGVALRHAFLEPTTDLAGFLRFAHRNRLGGFAYWTLRRLRLTGTLPPGILAAAKAASLLEETRTERLASELRRLGELFEASDVRVLFLKGPLFAHRFYGGLERRAAADLDILIRGPRELERIEALLLDAGYEPAFGVLVNRRLSQYFSHHFEYRRDALSLDLHWAFQRHFTFAIDYDRVWATALRVRLADREYDGVSDEYELVLQLLGALTDLQVGKLALRSVVDIYQILKTVDGKLDWAEFFSWRKRERILRPSAYVLGVVLELLDCREEFATLGRALGPELRRLPSTGRGARAVLESRRFDAGQKLLALRIYESPLAASVAWWLVSLPFRMAVYGITRPLGRVE